MMATYFHGGSEIQPEAGDQNLQTLYLMNPNFIAAYSEAQTCCTPPNMLFLNNPSNSLSQGIVPHAPPPPQQQFIGIPLSGAQDHHSRPSPPPPSNSLQHHAAALHGLSVSRVHPNLWSPVSNPFTPSHSQSGSGPSPISASGPNMGDQMGFRRPMAAPQGLSLSLLSPGMQMHPQSSSPNQVTVAGGSSTNGVITSSKYLKATQELLQEVVNVANDTKCINNTTNNDSTNNNGVVFDSHTGDSIGAHKGKGKGKAITITKDHPSEGGGLRNSVSVAAGVEGSSIKAAAAGGELSTAQRQELQMKKAKLLNMLDEVGQRYRQYNTQMQVVVSSFEQAAGSGSAKLYTSLALNTISKQFRCLKDAIMLQIKSTSKSLGEEDINGNTNAGVKLEGGAGPGSRLRFVDYQLRQQRALQQLGMMQHNAWRPQRGLPERAVSVLRAWLFEHFLHPYPKDSDKHMLAKQTGLTRSQVSNWFINARVRLWKPMVEEMYLEEIKSQQQNSGNSEDNNTSAANKNSNSSKTDMTSTIKVTVVGQQCQDHGIIVQGGQQQEADQNTTNDMISNISASSSQGFTLIGSSSDMESLMGRSPKKQRSNSDMQSSSPSSILSMDMEMKQVDHHQQRHSFLMTNHHGDAAGAGFNPYIVNDDMAGRSFNPDQMTAPPYHGSTVSLTLGLPHCDNLSLGNHHQNFLSNHQAIPMESRLDNIGATADSDFCGISMAQASHPTNNGYESMDFQNRKRFAAQILHDFVAS